MEQNCIICNKQTGQTRLILNNIEMLQCNECKLIRRETFDVPMEYYESLDAKDNNQKRLMRKRNSSNRIKLFSKFVPMSGWCDVGTGEGIFLETLSEMGESGVGIEPSKSSCAKAKQNGVSIVGDSVENIDSIIKQNNIKVVSLFHVIEHLKEPDKAISDIYNALPNGGYLIIETPNIDSQLFEKCDFKDKLIYPEHFWYFSLKTLSKLLTKNNFQIITSGKRDFDQYNFPIKESLYRLGILSRASNVIDTPEAINVHIERNKNKEIGKTDYYLKSIIRNVFSRAVILTGRLQYMYFVVQKK